MKYLFPFLLSIIFTFFSCGSKEESSFHEIIVIGGGLMGSSTAWQLSQQGQSVLLLEKQDSIYTQGSSMGDARIARSNNRGNDIWSYLHNRSIEETKGLIKFLNNSSGKATYKIEDIYTTSPVTYVGMMRIYEKLAASLIRQKVKSEMAITPEQGMEKFGVTLPDSVLIQREFNQHSGIMNPQMLIQYLHKAIQKKGNQILYNNQVTNIIYNEKSKLYEITTTNGKTGNTKILSAQKVVSAAGPYTGKLLKDVAPYLNDLINPQRVFLAFFKIKKEIYNGLSEDQKNKIKSFYPVINSSKGTRQGSFFSMIEYYDQEGHPVIKIGGHFQRSNIENLDKIWNQKLSEKELEWSLNSTVSYFKLLNLPINKEDFELEKEYSCVYSLTQSEVPLVTPIISEDNLPNKDFIVLGGLSGVGAKGAMTYGLIAADLMNDKTQSDSLYHITRKALGFKRLLRDLKN